MVKTSWQANMNTWRGTYGAEVIMQNNDFVVPDFAIKMLILKMNVLLTTTRHRSTRFFASSLPTFLCLNNGIALRWDEDGIEPIYFQIYLDARDWYEILTWSRGLVTWDQAQF